MERMFEKDVIPACEELGVGFVPFSPLGAGFLSGKYSAIDRYSGDDVRRVITRFAPENVLANQPLLDMLQRFAEEKGASPAQIALAWMLHKSDYIVPIPGMRREERVRENLGSADVKFTEDELAALEKALSEINIHGNRTEGYREAALYELIYGEAIYETGKRFYGGNAADGYFALRLRTNKQQYRK